jgi:hypothetical protein
MWQTEGYIACKPDLCVYNTQWVKDHHEHRERGLIDVVPGQDLGGFTQINFRLAAPPKTFHVPGIIVHPQVDPLAYATVPNYVRKYITMVNFFEGKGPEVFWAMAERFPKQKFLAVKGGYGKQIIPKEIPENVMVIENTPYIQNVYSMTKLLLMPSKYESFGRVPVEAAAQGVPTVYQKTPGLIESQVGMEELGVDGHEFDDWETKLRWVLNPARLKRFSNMAYDVSSYWDSKRNEEAKNFVDTMTMMASKQIYRR